MIKVLFVMRDEQYMRRCFELAKLGAGHAAPNPMVGSVVVYQDKIIGEGYHIKCGSAHAEVNAIQSVSTKDMSLLPKATIYVSLEPCFHFGKTPPCVDLILKHKIPRVVISVRDPNPKVSGKSIEKLKTHGVEVVTGCLETEGRKVAKRFLTFFEKRRPYIILKYAQTKDGFISKMNAPFWITNAYSKRLIHKWRNEESAIIVGTNTADIDNPALTNRMWGNNSPVRIVIDSKGRLREDLKLFDGSVQTIVFCNEINISKQKTNVTYITLDFQKNLPTQIVHKLFELKLNSLIVEGGTVLLQSFIDSELWDEARIFTGNKYLGEGLKAPTFDKLYERTTTQIGEDQLEVMYKIA